MGMTKEWLHNNTWVVCVDNEQEGAAVFEYLRGKYGIPATPYEGEQIYREGTTGIAHATVFPYLWFTSLEEGSFENNITSLVLAEMQAENEKQMSEQKYIPVPEGGWTEENIPLEFEYELHIAGEVIHYWYKFNATKGAWELSTGDSLTTEEVLYAMNSKNERRITKIIKPSKEQQMKEAAHVIIDNNSPLPFLKPFVRLVTRGRGSYIYQGIREGENIPHPGMHHAVQSNQSYDVWGDDLLGQDPRWDVIAIHDVPETVVYLLESEHKGKLLWQREDSKLKELQQAVEEAVKALEDYKREKGVV